MTLPGNNLPSDRAEPVNVDDNMIDHYLGNRCLIFGGMALADGIIKYFVPPAGDYGEQLTIGVTGFALGLLATNSTVIRDATIRRINEYFYD